DVPPEARRADWEALAQQKTVELLKRLPDLRLMLEKDVQAALEGDPAAKGYHEIIFCYPGLEAVTIYRIAHELLLLGVPLVPRMMTEHAHSKTGIDIHPGARIGSSFFIDHGTGVVIGETCDIGKHVRLYQGVTLGALSFPRDASGNIIRGMKRHPMLEDEVVVYANATILGGDTVIGHHAVIGSNVWITEGVAPSTVVSPEKPTRRIKGPGRPGLPDVLDARQVRVPAERGGGQANGEQQAGRQRPVEDQADAAGREVEHVGRGHVLAGLAEDLPAHVQPARMALPGPAVGP